MDIEYAERTLLGVSLSGLFAIWSAFNTDAFTNIISLSGSLWYDGFVEWMKEQTPSPQLKKICMLLGEKEKNAKEKRMSTVEERSLAAAVSPILPRMERAMMTLEVKKWERRSK